MRKTYTSVFRDELFKDQVIIVTGGGSGIGRCTAHELSGLGASIAVVGRTREKLEKTQAEIVEDGGHATVHPGDIRSIDDVREVISEVLDAHGRIDGLVNNAGGQFRAPLTEISTNGFNAVVQNNLTGGFNMMREAYLQYMREHGGSIVNIIADMWSGWPMYGHSGAARAGMLNLTETAAAEWGESGVRVNAVAPGQINSSGLDTYPAKDLDYIQRDLKGEVPLQRMGTESEIAAAITFLLSPAAAFISGTALRVDGGAPNGSRTWVKPPTATNVREFNGFHRAITPDMIKSSLSTDERTPSDQAR